MNISQIIILNIRRISVIILNLMFNWKYFYVFLGFLNKNFFNGLLKTVFLLYPANEKYTRAYVYQWYAESMRWSPRLVGVLWQNNRVGLIFGVSSSDKDFMLAENQDKLKQLEMSMESIRKMISADQKTFAGVLPSVMCSKEILLDSHERHSTVEAVKQALEIVRKKERLNDGVPVIVIGGKGFIGSEFLRKVSGNFFSVDLGNQGDFVGLAEKFKGEPAIVLNLSKRGALLNYAQHFWPGLVILNEVYPEPSKREVAAIKTRGGKCYHVVGVKGGAMPSFPQGYAGGIPCCASFLPTQVGEGKYEVILSEM